MMIWDENKRVSNRLPPPKGHGLDFADARDRFEWDRAIISDTYPSKNGRPRKLAIGPLDGELVTLIFSPLGNEAVSAVSLRPASRKERARYAK